MRGNKFWSLPGAFYAHVDLVYIHHPWPHERLPTVVGESVGVEWADRTILDARKGERDAQIQFG